MYLAVFTYFVLTFHSQRQPNCEFFVSGACYECSPFFSRCGSNLSQRLTDMLVRLVGGMEPELKIATYS